VSHLYSHRAKSNMVGVDVYPVAQQLGKIVGFDYNFPDAYSRRTPGLAYPEARLLSLLVVAVKLCHPFDGVERTPRSVTEPAAFSIDWDKWKDIHEKFDKEQRHDAKIGKQNAAEVTESNVFDMNGDELDKYMDWYQNTWLETGRRFTKGRISITLVRYPWLKSRAASTEILNFFPIDRSVSTPARGASSPTSTADDLRERLRQVQGTLKGPTPLSDEDAETHEGAIIRPGMAYRHYRIEAELPPAAKSFYEAAAAVVGLSLSALTKAVFRTELRLDSWQREKRKKEKQMRMSIDGFDELLIDPMNWDEEG
jgi:RNA polymerase I-specific transcription initiation factor RRN7